MSTIVVPWSDPVYENGLGFGMGSTDGVVNKYQYRGFHRPGLPEPRKDARDALNLRACNGAYSCHFDPEFDVRYRRRNSETKTDTHAVAPPKSKWPLLFIAIVFGAIAIKNLL